jgi:hypothetical protein
MVLQPLPLPTTQPAHFSNSAGSFFQLSRLIFPPAHFPTGSFSIIFHRLIFHRFIFQLSRPIFLRLSFRLSFRLRLAPGQCSRMGHFLPLLLSLRSLHVHPFPYLPGALVPQAMGIIRSPLLQVEPLFHFYRNLDPPLSLAIYVPATLLRGLTSYKARFGGDFWQKYFFLQCPISFTSVESKNVRFSILIH